MVIIDTSAWIELLRRNGDPAIKLSVKALLDRAEATICGPVEMELVGGASPEQRPKLTARLSVVPYHRCGGQLWKTAGQSYSLLRSKGLTLPWNDVLVASVSLLAESRIYAPDHHFNLMAPVLGLRLYSPGPGFTFNPESN